MPRRYQRGSVKFDSKLKMWIGRFRLDMPGGSRIHKKVRIGTKQEYPNTTSARGRLDEIRCELSKTVEVRDDKRPANFKELVERWKAAEGNTYRLSTLTHYVNALNGYIIPTFGAMPIDSINREQIQTFLVEKSKKYSESSLRSMRRTLSLAMVWAVQNRWIEHNPAEKLRLPKKTGGRKVVRRVLVWSEVARLMEQMEEPYRTLVLFLAMVPKRIEEAIALKPSDLDEGNILHVRRVIYDGKVMELEESEFERIPLDTPIHAELVRRMRQLGKGKEWIFCSRRNTPVNPGNALKRNLHPAAEVIGIRLGGWHDFRHTFSTAMSRAGVRLKVRTEVLGQGKRIGVLAHDVYDHASENEIRLALVIGANWLMKEEEVQKALLGSQLYPQLCPDQAAPSAPPASQ